MTISEKTWVEYITRLSRLNETAGQKMADYIERYGTVDTDALISYAQALVQKYGEGSAELACQMYDAMAEASGAEIPPAEPAEPADHGETAMMVNATKQSPPLLQSGVSRLVKRTAADTTLKNAIRDGAEWAWVPHGDTCPFCITLASRGWQKASQKALKGDHAEHIHANCDCEYAIRFDSRTTVAGYDPEQYLKQYNAAGGDLNAMRRAQYTKNKDAINAQKRAAYARRKGLSEPRKDDRITFRRFDSGDDANNFFYYNAEERGLLMKNRSQYGQWKKSLTEDEQDRIYDYTAGGYGDINDYLRQRGAWEGISAQKVQDSTQYLDSAISRYILKDNIIVQRGVMEDALDELIAQYGDDTNGLIGKIFHDNGYVSTSALYGNPVATTKPVIFEISVPAGTGRGAYVNELSGFKDAEYEFLLRRGADYTITDVAEDSDAGKIIVKMVMNDV